MILHYAGHCQEDSCIIGQMLLEWGDCQKTYIPLKPLNVLYGHALAAAEQCGV